MGSAFIVVGVGNFEFNLDLTDSLEWFQTCLLTKYPVIEYPLLKLLVPFFSKQTVEHPCLNSAFLKHALKCFPTYKLLPSHRVLSLSKPKPRARSANAPPAQTVCSALHSPHSLFSPLSLSLFPLTLSRELTSCSTASNTSKGARSPLRNSRKGLLRQCTHAMFWPGSVRIWRSAAVPASLASC